jgi:Flp pilus assembly protein TadD
MADLAVLEPVPVTTLRAATEDSALARGAELYRDGDYRRAVEPLRAATSRRPGDAEVRLLLGSAELLAGSPREAAATLLEASRLAGSGELRAVCVWHLVNAYLRTSDREAALGGLADLQRAPGPIAARARALSEKLARARR